MILEAVDDTTVARAYLLKEGDVLTVFDITVQFGEDELFYEVYEVKYVGLDGFYQPTWARTGRVFTANQLNAIGGY